MRTLGKCRKHSPAAHVFYFSLLSKMPVVFYHSGTRLRLIIIIIINTLFLLYRGTKGGSVARVNIFRVLRDSVMFRKLFFSFVLTPSPLKLFKYYQE